MAGMAFSMPCGRGQPCLVAQGWSKEVGGRHWMLWMAAEVRREVRKREKWAVQREKVGFYPSNN